MDKSKIKKVEIIVEELPTICSGCPVNSAGICGKLVNLRNDKRELTFAGRIPDEKCVCRLEDK